LNYNHSTTRFQVREYVTGAGHNPFEYWLLGLKDVKGRAIIGARIDRVSLGNLGDYKPIAEGVSELRLNFGPGYRVYFAFERDKVILLLGGGSKNTQQRDIQRAIYYWKDYLRNKNGNE
jgi:putative addiction module killer protein